MIINLPKACSKYLLNLEAVILATALAALSVFTPNGGLISAAVNPRPPASLTQGYGTGASYCANHGSSTGSPVLSFEDVFACDTASTTNSIFDSYSSYSFQCVELSSRYLWAHYSIWAGPGVDGGRLNGANLVSWVGRTYGVPIGSPNSGRVPAVGDVISLGPGPARVTDVVNGHTGIVVASDASTGSFTIISENETGTGPGLTQGVVRSGGPAGDILMFGRWTPASWLELGNTLVTAPTSAQTTSSSQPYHVVLAGQGPGGTVAEYSGPSSNYSEIGTLPMRSIIHISCQISGGAVRSTKVWDQLTNGNYVSDYYIDTPAVNGFTSGIPRCPSPPLVTSPSSATAKVALGDYSACALLKNGTVECWGYNTYGELGNGTTTNSSTPVEVSNLTGVTQIDVGPDSACAIVVDGTVDCWGLVPLSSSPSSPSGFEKVIEKVVGLSGVSQISPGVSDACALLNNGTVECWGIGSDGELGNGVSGEFGNGPGGLNISLTPATVPNLKGVAQISSGWLNTCALLTTGTVECWGDNQNGELGNGTTINSSTPVEVSNLTGVKQISAGESQTCALLTNGSVECWGGGLYGTFGSTVPVTIPNLSNVLQIAVGPLDACALLGNGGIVCWGDNSYGELGNGTTNSSSTPIRVTDLTSVKQIAIGFASACAMKTNGKIVCWGDNPYGQLGNGTTTNSSTPVGIL